MNLSTLMEDDKYHDFAVTFENYWNTNGSQHWESKTAAYVSWLNDNWNSGSIGIEDYRYLISVEMDDV